MGGLALKNTYTRRYERQEFEDIKNEIFSMLKGNFNRYDIPRFYYKKETFGDIDIIVSLGGFIGDMREFINSTFKPNEIFHNGNAWSFDYKELQVDFITCADEDYDSNYHYLAFNDLGNFIGRLAQSIGLKYGQEGLWYNHYSDSNTKTKIMVSKDYRKIFAFLGLDYDVWLTGFNTLEEIFDYTITSQYFNADMFQLSELNKINRERNVKRESYMSFLDYIKDEKGFDRSQKILIKSMKDNVIGIIKEYFPEANLDVHLAEINFELAKKKLVNTKFNGKILMEKYGLEGKELGDTIKKFKNTIGWIYERKYPSFEEYILDTNIEKIYSDFEDIYKVK